MNAPDPANRPVSVRRASDLSGLVRRWVLDGAVDPNVATRLLLERAVVDRPRAWTWLRDGAPRRRADD